MLGDGIISLACETPEPPFDPLPSDTIFDGMSSLALEIDQTLQQLAPVTASRLERLLRDAQALIKPTVTSHGALNEDISFPLVQGAKPITDEGVARLLDEALIPDSDS